MSKTIYVEFSNENLREEMAELFMKYCAAHNSKIVYEETNKTYELGGDTIEDLRRSMMNMFEVVDAILEEEDRYFKLTNGSSLQVDVVNYGERVENEFMKAKDLIKAWNIIL